jgi:hypothetical protein
MTRLERWLMLVSSVLVTATGVVYLWMKQLLPNDDPFAVINHPLQPMMLKLHILTAPFLVFALGLIAVRHVLAHWMAGMPRARRSGVTAALTIIPMILSGYLVQAITNARWLAVTSWVHVATGLIYAAAFAVHQVMVRRRPTRPQPPPTDERTPIAASAARAAWNPPMPWTPPPGGVDAEQR